MFFRLARVNAALRAEIDRSLQAKHELTFEALDAMTVISEWPEGCEEGAVAGDLGLTPDDMEAIIESLVSSGYAKRTRGLNGARAPAVILTLRGRLVMSRAGRIVDESLAGTVGSALSPPEISGLENALADLRRRPAAEEPARKLGAERCLAADRVIDAGSI
jgi:DNA-binding MarR family transcriptional regulator